MNVFVLCTGRCGSVTFAKACKHLANYTVGHESRWPHHGAARFDYPENHIEIDNRLTWFLGELDERYGDKAFYVHLIRDREATAESFDQRWEMTQGIIRAYAEVLLGGQPYSVELARNYWDTVNANIRLFLKDKTHKMVLHMETAPRHFPAFLSRIGAQGNLQAAVDEWTNRYNETKPPMKPRAAGTRLQQYIKAQIGRLLPSGRSRKGGRGGLETH
jgi:hypothetical protein